MKQTTEDIVEGNKLIAEFMGARLSKRNGEDAVYMFEDAAFPEYFRVTIYNKYHTDWNQLMKVVSKVGESYVKYNTLAEMKDLHEMTIFADIEKIWNLLVAFIKWYNTQNPNT